MTAKLCLHCEPTILGKVSCLWHTWVLNQQRLSLNDLGEQQLCDLSLPGEGEIPHPVFYELLSREAIFLVLSTFKLPVGFC